tara:strand:- start:1097 stop:1630 length:534 start_codon:yes stop_codon:yes gene_type:complete
MDEIMRKRINDTIKNYNSDNMLCFLKIYEIIFLHRYLNSYKKYGAGLLWVDMNSFSSPNYITKYIPIKDRDLFWNQSRDIIYIKNIIIKDKYKKYYIWLMDNDVSIFFERDCPNKINNKIKNIDNKEANKDGIDKIKKNIKNYLENTFRKKKVKKNTTVKKIESSDDEEIVNSIINY